MSCVSYVKVADQFGNSYIQLPLAEKFDQQLPISRHCFFFAIFENREQGSPYQDESPTAGCAVFGDICKSAAG